MADDRRGDRATALAGVLDETGYGNFRLVCGRIRDEPSVVPVVAGDAFVLVQHSADDLRGAGLPGHCDIGELRGTAGSLDTVDHLPHRVPDHGQVGFGDVQAGQHLGRLAVDDDAILVDGVLHERRTIDHAAVGDRGRGDGHVERGRHDGALADRHVERLTAVPRLVETAPFPCRVGEEPPDRFQGQPQVAAQPEAARVLGRGVDPQPFTEPIEIHVARLDDGLLQIHPPMPPPHPTAERAAAGLQAAGTIHVGVGRDDAGFERSQRHHGLQCRARGIAALQDPVGQRLQRVVQQRPPLVGQDTARKEVRVERRAADGGQDGSRTDVEHDQRALGVAHRLLGPLLQAQVEGQADVVAGVGFDLVQDAQFASRGIDFDLLGAGPPAQQVLPGLLQTPLADDVPAPILVGIR